VVVVVVVVVVINYINYNNVGPCSLSSTRATSDRKVGPIALSSSMSLFLKSTRQEILVSFRRDIFADAWPQIGQLLIPSVPVCVGDVIGGVVSFNLGPTAPSFQSVSSFSNPSI